MNDFDTLGLTNDVVSFEDSYVLEIRISPRTLTVSIDAALRMNHGLYRKPEKNEAHCYKECVVEVSIEQYLSANLSSLRIYGGKDNEKDFGSVDNIWYSGGEFGVSGDFGEIRAKISGISVNFDEV